MAHPIRDNITGAGLVPMDGSHPGPQFFVKLSVPVNGTHEGALGYTISTGFRGLMGDQRTPGFWGVTDVSQALKV